MKVGGLCELPVVVLPCPGAHPPQLLSTGHTAADRLPSSLAVEIAATAVPEIPVYDPGD